MNNMPFKYNTAKQKPKKHLMVLKFKCMKFDNT